MIGAMTAQALWKAGLWQNIEITLKRVLQFGNAALRISEFGF
jgi:hypothetical protein